MCFKPRKVGLVVLMAFWCLSMVSQPVWADPTDTGSITVSGTVAPVASSITTAISANPSSGSVAQNQTVTYTLQYTSSNLASVPVTIQAQWDKGTVAGATEANVELLTYVVGSATSAYGGAPAVVDTLNRTITWTIPSLAGGLGPQNVTFQLQTTSNYTGSLTVTAPVTAVVLLPAGVSDKTATLTYAYQAPAATPTPSTSNGTTATTSVTPTPTPSSGSTTNVSTKKNLKSVLIRAVGKTTAKVTVTADTPLNLNLAYGSSPVALETRISNKTQKSEQILYLTNLVPESQYYFQIEPESSSAVEKSDIYTFTTADADALEAARKASLMTVTQDRTVVYSADISGADGKPLESLSVSQNSVIDLNLHIPDQSEILSFEVEIRSAQVLGTSTQPLNSDDLQSQTTKMTKISDGVYVGKLRTPPETGRYQLVSRIEDIYGNLSEEEFGTLKVTEPMVILNAQNNKPIEHARVNLLVYNQQTRLYETLSNVTTSITNPTYSDRDGVVALHLYPAKYKAEISAIGYESQSIEFTVGAEESIQFPRVRLQPKGFPLLIPLGLAGETFSNILRAGLHHFEFKSESPSLYNGILVVHTMMIVGLSVLLWRRKQRAMMGLETPVVTRRWYLDLARFMAVETLKFWMNIYLMNAVLLSYFFTQNLGVLQGLFFSAITFVLLVLWILVIWGKSLKKWRWRSS